MSVQGKARTREQQACLATASLATASPGFERGVTGDVVESVLEHVVARLDGDADRRRHGAPHVRRLEVRVLRLLLRHLRQVEALAWTRCAYGTPEAGTRTAYVNRAWGPVAAALCLARTARRARGVRVSAGALTVVVRGDPVLVSVRRRWLGRDLLAGGARGGGLLRAQGPQPRRHRLGPEDSDRGSHHRAHRTRETNLEVCDKFAG